MSAVDMVREDGSGRPVALVGGAGRRHQGGGRGAGGRAHLRQPRDQEGAVRNPRGRALDDQGPAFWGHNYHFHVRMNCPAGDAACEGQTPPPPGDGCDKSLNWWFTDEALHPAPGNPRRRSRFAQLPPECRQVVLRSRRAGRSRN